MIIGPAGFGHAPKNTEPPEPLGGPKVYQHKYIPTFTMIIEEVTKRGYKCIVKDPNGIGKIRKGKVEYFHKQDVEGSKALFYPLP